tara:strand:+ start:1223 stop:1489 length:267 start_codon:yes stop_codon:yes gene_type:complete
MLKFIVLLIALLLLVSLFTSMLLGLYHMLKQIKGSFISNLSKFVMIGTAVLLFTYTSRYVVEPVFLNSVEKNVVYDNIIGFLSSFIGY